MDLMNTEKAFQNPLSLGESRTGPAGMVALTLSGRGPDTPACGRMNLYIQMRSVVLKALATLIRCKIRAVGLGGKPSRRPCAPTGGSRSCQTRTTLAGNCVLKTICKH